MISRHERRSGLERRRLWDAKRERRSYSKATDRRWKDA